MNILAASKNLTKATKLFAAAGLNLEQFLATDDESVLKAHIESLVSEAKTAAPDAATVELTLCTAAGVTPAAGEKPLDALKRVLGAAQATASAHTTLTTALTAAGVKLTASDPKAGLTAADVKSALAARVSTMAAEFTATIGTRPIETTPTPSAGSPDSKACTRAEFFAKSPADRLAFSKAGGRLTD